MGVDDTLLWARRHPDAVATSTSLALLALYCSELDTSRARIQSSDVLSLLQDAPVAEHQVLFYVNHCAPQLLSGLSTAPLPSSADNPHTDSSVVISSELDAIVSDTCGQLVVFLLQRSHCRAAERFLATEAQALDVSNGASSPDIGAAFVRAQDLVRKTIERFLLSQGTTLDALVDDIVSRVLASAKTTADAPYRRLESRVRQILRNTSLLGLDRFSRLLHRVPPKNDASVASEAVVVASPWNGRWICRRVDWKRLHSSHPQYAAVAETEPTPMLGLAGVLLVLVCAFGFDIELVQQSQDDDDDDEQKAIELAVRILPLVLSSASRQSACSLPLDDVFRDASDVLPTLPFALLDIDGVKCRGRRLKQSTATSPALEIEWRSGTTWRSMLTLAPELERSEVPVSSRRPHRRVLTLTVRLEEGRHELHDGSQDQGDNDEEEEDGSRRESTLTVQWRPRWVCTSSYEALS
ncbi:hypothetical protein PINS_up000704 [Pythium insidiosum]|nr:hypothetical protein PINS_up000704 [Pythium insidiosum]